MDTDSHPLTCDYTQAVLLGSYEPSCCESRPFGLRDTDVSSRSSLNHFEFTQSDPPPNGLLAVTALRRSFLDRDGCGLGKTLLLHTAERATRTRNMSLFNGSGSTCSAR